MGEITEFNQDHPFMFKIERIKEYIKSFIKDGDFDPALKRLDEIHEKYKNAKRDKTIPQNSWTYRHLRDYLLEENELKKKGETFPGNSTDKVIFELNQIRNWIIELRKPKEKQTVKFVALLLFYDGIDVNSLNIDQIAQKYGFENGKKLQQHYNFYSKFSDRTADPESKAKLNHKIELFEKVRDSIEEGKRGKIEDEIKILKSYLPRY